MQRLLMWAAGLSLLASCRRAPPPPEGARPTAETRPAQATVTPGLKLAYASGKSLCVQRLAPDALPPKVCTTLPDTIAQLAWVNRDEIAALLASGSVVLANDQGTRALPLPPESTWERPPPRDGKGNVAVGAEHRTDKRHLFTSGGEVWIARCPWWFILDAGGCHEWVSARLSPSPSVKVERADPPGFRAQVEPAFEGAEVPADVHIKAEKGQLVCERGGVKGVFTPELMEPVPTLTWSWVPRSASHYLVTVTHDFLEATRSSTYWMKACDAKPERELHGVVIGSDGFWGHDDEKGWALRHGDRALGVIDGALPVFAPTG
jgi:hypothetical protein